MEHIKKILHTVQNEKIDKKNAIFYFSILSDYINKLFMNIKSCIIVQDADEYFTLLHEIHFILALLAFREEIPLPEDLSKFVTDFDRIDDKEWREYLFNKIISGNYSLQGEPALYDRFRQK